MHDLTAFQRDVLYVIAGMTADPKGLAIKAELEAYYDGEINHGRLYPNLDTLVEQDLVAKGTIDKRTNAYTLTEQGEQTLAARRAWEAQQLDTLPIESAAPQADD